MDTIMEQELRKLAEALRAKSISGLKELGEDIAEEAFLRNDPRLLDAVIISYAMAKLFEKPQTMRSPHWKAFFSELLEKIEACRKALKKEETYAFELLHSALEDIEAFAREAPRSQTTLVEKARVKAATQVYAHGASLEAASKFAGVAPQALASYVGLTKIPDKYETLSLKERLKMAEEIFSK